MAAGTTLGMGFLMAPAVGAAFMSAFTNVVAIIALLLQLYREKAWAASGRAKSIGV